MPMMALKEPKFRQEIQQMMYIAGEPQDPSLETLSLIEVLVHEQVVQMLTTARDLAYRRGARLFSNHDIIFQIRHDPARIERVRNFLTWKAIRKTVKDADDKDALDKDGLENGAVEDEPSSGPADDMVPRASGAKTMQSVSLPWDTNSFFRTQVPEGDDSDGFIGLATLDKLRRNDERTRDMSIAEYATWSEYRHASFTWRKVKRFREWAGLGVIAEHKPNDDVLDILGFLTSEMVQNLTAEALKIQAVELAERGKRLDPSMLSPRPHGESLFSQPADMRSPIEPRHVRQASQVLQARMAKKSPFKMAQSSLGLI